MRNIWLILLISLLSWQQAFSEQKYIPLKEVQSHMSAKDCWIIVNDKIYDITKFIKVHNDNCKEIKLTDLCGKDASMIWLGKEKSAHTHKHRSVLEFERSGIGRLK